MGSPVGSYFEESKVNLIIDETYLRGHPLNAASHKIGANYAPTIQPTFNAMNNGYLQTIWSYDGNLIESGASNIFFVLKKNGKFEVVTHPNDGCILPGIVRDSIIKLTRDKFDFDVVERNFTIDEFLETHRSGELIEVFMSGTAAVISQVDMIKLRDKKYHFTLNKENNHYSNVMCDYIQKIQYGEIDHPFSELI